MTKSPVSDNTDKRIITATVPDQAAGTRLDVWLTARFTYHSRRQWQKIIRDGVITVNGEKCRNSRKLQIGDKVEYAPDLPEPEIDPAFEIVHEDENLLVINKSGNLPCHPAGPFFKHTLWYLLRKDYPQVSIVNRLDRETSGLVMAAKNSAVANNLAGQFASGKVHKKYLAVVFGEFPEEIDAKGCLVPDPDSEVRKKVKFVLDEDADTESPDFAETKLTKLSSANGLSAIIAEPKTGRFHQIRATLFSLGFPMVGDKLYGPDDQIYLRFADGKMTEDDAEKLIMNRQALHAFSLEYLNPDTNKLQKQQIPLPNDILSLSLSNMDYIKGLLNKFGFLC